MLVWKIIEKLILYNIDYNQYNHKNKHLSCTECISVTLYNKTIITYATFLGSLKSNLVLNTV